MFVLLLTYIKPLDEVDALMRKHMAWLNSSTTPAASSSRAARSRGPAA